MDFNAHITKIDPISGRVAVPSTFIYTITGSGGESWEWLWTKAIADGKIDSPGTYICFCEGEGVVPAAMYTTKFTLDYIITVKEHDGILRVVYGIETKVEDEEPLLHTWPPKMKG